MSTSQSKTAADKELHPPRSLSASRRKSSRVRSPLMPSIMESPLEEKSMASTTSSDQGALASKARFTATDIEKSEQVSMGSSHHPHSTSSKTRFEVEALKKELAAIKASMRMSRLREIDQLVQSMRNVQDLDLAFLFDATSSMHCYMEVVKREIFKIVQGISDAYPESHIRVAFAFYRDYWDEPNCGSCNFTTSFSGSGSTFVQALSSVEASGGADTCEDVFSGLEAIAKLNWTAYNRVVYHIADAPCHGTRFHDVYLDDYFPNGDFHGRDISALLRDLREHCKLSTYTFLHVYPPWTQKMLQEFKKAAGSDSGWIHEDDFQGSGVDDIPEKVVTVCKSTISQSLSTAKIGLSYVKFVPRDVKTAMPDWDSIRMQEGEVYKFKRYGDLDDVLRLIERGISLELEKAQPVQVQVGLHPFSNDGALRWPFYARIVTHEFDTKVMVLKRFKDRIGEDSMRMHSKEKYIEQMEVQTISAQFAEEFNRCVRYIAEAKKVFCIFSKGCVCLSTMNTRVYYIQSLIHGHLLIHHILYALLYIY